LGIVSRFKDLTELYEGIALTIYYYNHNRIHKALKMSPIAYATGLLE
jgi:transposase InsO family protein